MGLIQYSNEVGKNESDRYIIHKTPRIERTLGETKWSISALGNRVHPATPQR